MWKRHTRPWSHFFDQIEEFNPLVEDGGLAHDDEIDTVAMSKFVLKGTLSKTPNEEADNRTWVERMVDGDRYMDKVNIAEGVDIRHISYHDVERILASREESLANGNGSRNKI